MLHRFAAVRAVSLPLSIALCCSHRPNIFPVLDVKRFKATVPTKAVANVATAKRGASNKTNPQRPKAVPAAGRPPTNNGNGDKIGRECDTTTSEHRSAPNTVAATADDILKACVGHFKVTNAPQAGRTDVRYASLTSRARCMKMSPPNESLAIYLGLNEWWSLGKQERGHLHKGGLPEVECVLLQRLLIALDVTLTECQGDLNRLNGDGDDWQKIPLPQGEDIPFFSEIDVDSVKKAIIERMRSLVELCPKKKSGYRLHVSVALDDARVLNDFIPRGAEFGSRSLEQLESFVDKATKKQCLFFPFVTGMESTASRVFWREEPKNHVGRAEDDSCHGLG